MGTNRFVLAVFALAIATVAVAEQTPESRDLDVTFSNPTDGAALHGTLTLPLGDGPFPVVLMIHGSGPQSRDENSSGSLLYYHAAHPVPLFARIAETLAGTGVASMRYDKRTCIGSNSGGTCSKKEFDWDVDTATLDLFAEDAKAAVAWLRERPEIRPDAIVVLGHSQGAVLAPVVAQLEPGVAGVVLLGCPAAEDPHLDHSSQHERLLRYQLSLEKRDEAKIAELRATVDEQAEFAASMAAGTRTEPHEGISATFWTSWFGHKIALRERLKALDIPVAAFTGGFDRNLPADPHLENIRTWRGARKGDLYATVPRTSHALVGLDPSTFELVVHSGFLELLSSWVIASANGTDLASEAHALVAEDGTLGGWGDPITPARDALLCRAAERDCDIEAIGARMSPEMIAAIQPEDLTGLLAGDPPGVLATVENLRIDVHDTEGGSTWCQEDLLTDADGGAGVLLTCWQRGPTLVGVFNK